jgi:hypothetical protein
MGNFQEMLCAICRYEGILSSYSVKPATLCTDHYFEWAQEKMYDELDSSTEGMYL